METFWTVLFGVIAGLVLAVMLARVIMEEKGEEPEFSATSPPLSPDELESHQERWDRSKDEDAP